MILLLDVGNTRIKGALLAADGRIGPSTAVTHGGHWAQAVDELLQQLAASEPVEQVWLASVAGEHIETMQQQLQASLQVVVRRAQVSPQACGVRCGYEDVSRLGIDRWLALIAGFRHSSGPVCVIDCGSAMTVDVVDAGGQHLGGYIIPGLQMMAEALQLNTQQIRVDQSVSDSCALGNNTAEAVIHGTYYALLAVVQQKAAELEQQMGAPVPVFLTGGDAQKLFELCDRVTAKTLRVEQDLVLQGLVHVLSEQENI